MWLCPACPLISLHFIYALARSPERIGGADIFACSSAQIQYINPIGLENISWKYYIIECIFIACLVAIIYFSFVETHGYTLEEIAVLFDGEEAFSNMAAVHANEMEKGRGIEMEESVAQQNV